MYLGYGLLRENIPCDAGNFHPAFDVFVRFRL